MNNATVTRTRVPRAMRGRIAVVALGLSLAFLGTGCVQIGTACHVVKGKPVVCR